jgi:hypothetical protein
MVQEVQNRQSETIQEKIHQSHKPKNNLPSTNRTINQHKTHKPTAKQQGQQQEASDNNDTKTTTPEKPGKKNTTAAEDINRPMTANPEPKSHLN